MLMEDDTEERYSMFHDSLALQHTERSFLEAINHNYPSPSYSSSTHYHLDNYPSVDSPEPCLSACSADNITFSASSSCASNNTTSSSEFPLRSLYPLLPDTTDEFVFHSNSTQSTINTPFGFFDNPLAEIFERRVDLGTLFLPANTPFSSSFTKVPHVVIKTEAEEGDHFLTGRKQREREEYEAADGRSRKQSAAHMDESELSELFDKVVLGTDLRKRVPPNTTHKTTILTNMLYGGDVWENDDQVVDLRTLLMLCAQAIASDNPSSAKQLVKQIMQHSSPTCNETQRLAHYFGNALEARLDGTGYKVCSALSSKRTSAKDMIKAYHVYASVCPFEKLAIIFANNSIWNPSVDAKAIHIIDFGIRYGFKWPALISRLSRRSGGPPKLRITGIDVPQPGLRPQERVLETGRRLANFCKRFNVPFEFNAIAQRWDTIRVEDLKIEPNEFVAVNCLFQFEHLLDETVVLNNSRDAVLRLIKNANPDIFVHGIVNGSYDVPFFVSRFREALFHYTALFDMLDTNVARQDPMRLMFEKELFGREIVNIIACEGFERVERPQTYKQWQLRNMRNGFRLLPLDHRIIGKLKDRLRDDAHNNNFLLEVDGDWVLQGWKGRILYASSCWVPA
ncbi:hypothetical protein JHK85_038795 [Glycine max]|nr:hypothetical protein JHK85_038795 [Glycine max]